MAIVVIFLCQLQDRSAVWSTMDTADPVGLFRPQRCLFIYAGHCSANVSMLAIYSGASLCVVASDAGLFMLASQVTLVYAYDSGAS